MYIIIYDFGTSSVKTCLFNIDSEIHVVANAKADYGIYLSEDGGAEQDTEEWWEAICSTKREKITEAELQRKFFSYLTLIDDFDEQIERYWNKNEKRNVPWYLAQKKPDDLIISASPSCIIEPIAKRLGVNFMATEYDREYGVYLNNMMYAKEKAKYIFDHGFPMIDNFYSDSLADTPLALCAEKAYLVTNKARTVVD